MESLETTDGPRDSFIHFILAGPSGRRLCRSAEDRSAVCRSFTRGLARCGGASRQFRFEVLAYCVDDHWLRAVIESSHLKLRRGVLQPALEGYRQYRTESLDPAAALLEIVQSVQLLTVADQLAVVRHCHFAPVHLGLVLDPVDWRWSSHRIYLGLDEALGVTTRSRIAKLLAGGPGGWPFGYRYLMGEPQEGDTSVMLPHLEIQVLPRAETTGDRACFQALRRPPGDNNTDRAFEAAVDKVCRTTGCDARAFKSHPSSRRFRLERALLVERLTGTRKLMSIQELAVRLQCDRSWLYRTWAQCRVQCPELFAMEDNPHGGGLDDSLGSGAFARRYSRKRANVSRTMTVGK
jgi:hypothetical protein